MLDHFFIQYAELAGEQFVTEELSFMQLIQELLQTDIDSLPLHFDKIADTWPDKGSSVIDTLAALRSDISRQERRAVIEKFALHMQQRHSKQAQTQAGRRQQAAQAGAAAPVVDLLSADAARSAASSSSFLNTSGGFFGAFKSRGKPVKKVKPSARRGRNRDRERDRTGGGRKQGGDSINLEEFLK